MKKLQRFLVPLALVTFCLATCLSALAEDAPLPEQIPMELGQLPEVPQGDYENPEGNFEIPEQDLDLAQKDLNLPEADNDTPEMPSDLPEGDFDMLKSNGEVPAVDTEVAESDYELPGESLNPITDNSDQFGDFQNSAGTGPEIESPEMDSLLAATISPAPAHQGISGGPQMNMDQMSVSADIPTNLNAMGATGSIPDVRGAEPMGSLNIGSFELPSMPR